MSLIKLLPKSFKSFIFKNVLKGSWVYCPCCKSSLVTFFPYGNPPRSNSYCPVCHSLDRHRLTWYYLEKEYDFFAKINQAKAPFRILHVAPEPALFAVLSKLAQKNANIVYVPCDKFAEGYDKYPKSTKNYDLTALPEADNSFDLVLCSHVLEHIEEEAKALAEIRRVLKPEGAAILLVPMDLNRPDTYQDPAINTPELRQKEYGQHDHVRLYGRNFGEILAQNGFSVRTYKCETIEPSTQFKLGLLPSDWLFEAKKEV
jgi:SAM-dependent methyltransferase